jgi:hypothetical protein
MLSLQRLQPDTSYFRHSPIQRVISASIAVMISMLFLNQLNHDFLRKREPASSATSNLMMLRFIRSVPQNIEAKTPVLAQTAPKVQLLKLKPTDRTILQARIRNEELIEHSQNKQAKEQNSERELITIFPDQAASNTPSVGASNPQDKTAISKYGLDSTGIRQAYEASKSEIQKMAERNGSSLEDTKLTKHDKFQQAANRAAKPDCLRQGGSILSLFVVAYQVATDHCK